MTSAFWDTSALVSLCVRQQASAVARQLARQHGFTVWWCAPVEMHSAFERLARMGQLTVPGHASATKHLTRLRQNWNEVHPSMQLRSEAEALLGKFPLRAADSLQLAAAVAWTGGFPRGRAFIASDGQLLEAARKLGFEVIVV